MFKSVNKHIFKMTPADIVSLMQNFTKTLNVYQGDETICIFGSLKKHDKMPNLMLKVH